MTHNDAEDFYRFVLTPNRDLRCIIQLGLSHANHNDRPS